MRRLPLDELIDSFIQIVDTLCEDNDESFHSITYTIVTEVQVREIMLGKSNLRDYEPARRKELFTRLVVEALDPNQREKFTEAEADMLFKNWEESGLSFSDWWLQKTL